MVTDDDAHSRRPVVPLIVATVVLLAASAVAWWWYVAKTSPTLGGIVITAGALWFCITLWRIRGDRANRALAPPIALILGALGVSAAVKPASLWIVIPLSVTTLSAVTIRYLLLDVALAREIFSKNPEVQERMHKVNEASKEKETSKEE